MYPSIRGDRYTRIPEFMWGNGLYQGLVKLYGDCCALDSNLSKRLQFWSHELRASLPHFRTQSEKITAVSEFVFQKLYLSPNPRHTIVDWGQAMQERKCHPFMLAVLYGYFGEAAELTCHVLSDYSYRYVKFMDQGIFDLHNGGQPISSSQMLESLKSKCGQKSFEPLSAKELTKALYEEILKGHFSRENWEQVLTTLGQREKENMGSPRDFTTYAYVYEKLDARKRRSVISKDIFRLLDRIFLCPQI